MKNYTNNLQAIRKAKGLSLDDLVEKTGIPRSSLSHYENYKRGMSDERLKIISRILHVSVEDIRKEPVDISTSVKEDRANYTVNTERIYPNGLNKISSGMLEKFIEIALSEKDFATVQVLSAELAARKSSENITNGRLI